MRSLITRIHERLAERYRFIQYPRQQYLPRQPRRAFFRHDMPLYLRFWLVIAGTVLVGISAVVITLVGLLAYAMVTA
jgi:hypothetical protein